MSSYKNEEALAGAQEDPFIVALEKSHQTQHSLLSTVSAWVDRPNHTGLIEGYAVASNQAETSIRAPLLMIAVGDAGIESIVHRAQAMASVIEFAASDRRKQLEDVAPDAAFDRLPMTKKTKKGVKKLLRASQPSLACDRILEEYSGCLLSDINDVIDSVEVPVAPPETVIKSRKELVGKHVLDVVKISTGVAVGGYLLQLAEKL